MKKNNVLTMATLALSIFLAVPSIPTVDAKGGSSSSRSSFSSSKSSSWGSKSTSKPSSSSSKSSFWNSKSTSTKTTSALTPAQQKARTEYAKAKASGKAFPTRAAAVQDFKAKNATKYTTSFSQKPETRPSYIPEKTTVGGNTYNVTYNQNQGGYGYMNSLGTWIAYDVFSDAIMMSTLMDRNNYYVGSPPVLASSGHASHGGGFSFLTFLIVFVVGLLVVFIFVVRS